MRIEPSGSDIFASVRAPRQKRIAARFAAKDADVSSILNSRRRVLVRFLARSRPPSSGVPTEAPGAGQKPS